MNNNKDYDIDKTATGKEKPVAEEISTEKKMWLKSIGAVEFEEPVKYTYGFLGYNGCFNLSVKDIVETPLEVLRQSYEDSKKYALSFQDEKRKGTFYPHDLLHAGYLSSDPGFPKAVENQ